MRFCSVVTPVPRRKLLALEPRKGGQAPSIFLP